MPDAYEPTLRTRVNRLAQRGAYDHATIHQILDEGMICHVGFIADGQPVVIPTTYVRIDQTICLHGSPASRMLQTLRQGHEVCITVTLVDGLVLARSAFHHSMNYRSVVAFGTARVVDDPAEMSDILRAMTEHLIRGRWTDIRVPTIAELKRTLVLAIPIEEASAKIRKGPPLDDEEDYPLPVWAGIIPIRLAASSPIPDPRLPATIVAPEYATRYRGPTDA